MTDFLDSIPDDDEALETNTEAIDEVDNTDADEPQPTYRGSNADPAFGFVLAIALSVGLTPLLPANADLRYTIAWGVLAAVGVLGWLLGNADRIGQETPENVAWGIAFGVMVSVPFMVFFTGQFGQASRLMFPSFGIGTLLAYLVFVMPLAETLFFRGSIQRRLDFWIVGGLGGLWSVILFFPVMWGELVTRPAVAVFLAIALFVLNMMYSYVRLRNGLAAAWLCQITASLILFFVPFLQ
ncbi:MAG: CPBP family glutamic-type intramembrane protease [Chloroflexota bacterium]